MADAFRGFVSEPNSGRGTLSIIWDCLATIFLATWTVAHDDYHQEKWLQERLAIFAACIVFPEGLAADALREFVDVYRYRRLLRKCHGWERWSLKQGFLVAKDGVLVTGPDSVLTAAELLTAARSGTLLFQDLPSKQRIRQRSKADSVSKIIAIGQSGWFAANIISRLVRGFHISPLEDMTAAYVACGLMTSLFYFRCPQDIQEAFTVQLRDVTAPAKGEAHGDDEAAESSVRPAAGDVEQGPRRPTRVPTVKNLRWTTSADLTVDVDVSRAQLWSTFALLLVIFTGIHLASWRYPFPTEAEAWIWRGASMASGLTGGE